MKFLSKCMELENIILSEVTQSQKNTNAMQLNDKRILAQKFWIPEIQLTEFMKLKKKDLVLLRRGNKYGNKVWSRDWSKGHSETAPPGDPFHIQLPNPDTIMDVNKCLLTGAWYSCLLRGSASLTNTEVDALSQPSDWVQWPQWRS